MQARGFRLKQVWVDAEGFLGKGTKAGGMERPAMTLSQLLDELVDITAGTDETFEKRLYGELAAYARGIRELWELTRMSPDLFRVPEPAHQEKKIQKDLL
jgi:hypothetical protein